MFDDRAEAARYKNILEGDQARGIHYDPVAPRPLFKVYAERWLDTRPGGRRKSCAAPSRCEPGVRAAYLPPGDRLPVTGFDVPSACRGPVPARGLSTSASHRQKSRASHRVA